MTNLQTPKKYICTAQESMTFRIQKSITNSKKKPAFIPFIEVGYPDLEFSKELFYFFQKKGAAVIEVGIPFSDPLADGPVIQKASKVALDNKVSLKKAFELIGEVKDDIKIPLILFSYLNPILSFGLDNFIDELKAKNVAGVIIPDLPLEESEEISGRLKENDIDFILLVSPESGKDRVEKISKSSSGFIYLVSSTGVTGVRETFSCKLTEVLSQIKACSSLPVAVGFGVSKPKHIANLKEINVDGAVIASAFIKIIDRCAGKKNISLRKLDEYIEELYASS